MYDILWQYFDMPHRVSTPRSRDARAAVKGAYGASAPCWTGATPWENVKEKCHEHVGKSDEEFANQKSSCLTFNYHRKTFVYIYNYMYKAAASGYRFYLVSWHGDFSGLSWSNAKCKAISWWNLLLNKHKQHLMKLDWLTDWVTDCKDSAVISEGCNKETIVSGK